MTAWAGACIRLLVVISMFSNVAIDDGVRAPAETQRR
jgi:hypothetical protein